MKKYLLAFFVVLVIIFGAILLAFFSTPEEKTSNKNQNNNSEIPADSSEILYFYSETCHWCQKQKPIVEELEKEGVKFKWVNLDEDRESGTQYQITGTPTFIIGDKRLEGFREKEVLKNFWEENKK